MKRRIHIVIALFFLAFVPLACKVFKPETKMPILVTPVEITTEQLPAAYSGDEYSTLIVAKGGQGKYRFDAEGLPPCLMIGRKGKLVGRLSLEPGAYSFSVKVSDKKDPALQAKRDYSLVVYPALVFLDKKPVTAVMGRPYQETFTVSGGSGPLSVTVQGLPEGLTMDGSGTVSGVPLSGPGSYSVRMTAKDLGPLSKTITKKYRVRVYPALSVTAEDPVPVLVHGRVKTVIRARGGSGRYVFSSPDLPPCLTLDSSGVIKGAADLKRGSYTATVTIEDPLAGTSLEKKLVFKVVDFFPDPYEALNDEGIETGNVMTPDSESQYHTFDEPGDRDTVKLDLGAVEKNSVILLKTEPGTRKNPVMFSLFAPDGRVIVEKKDRDTPYFYFKCETPGIYHVALSTVPDETGDGSFAVRQVGPPVRISSAKLADVSRFLEVPQSVSAVGGSGSYRFVPLVLPLNLVLIEDGTLKGLPGVEKGDYPVKIRVEDRVYEGIYEEREFILTVVDFFPDGYEEKGDDDFLTSNVLTPSESVQKHTFNTPGDVDTVRVDLSKIPENHVILIETLPLTQPTRTILTLYDRNRNVLASGSETGQRDYGGIYLVNTGMDHVYATITEKSGLTGDYALKVTDRGPRVDFAVSVVPDALCKGDYGFQFEAGMGSGAYHFSGENLPVGLVLNRDGRLSGNLDLPPGAYPFHIRVDDQGFTGTGSVKEFVLNVVEYFPDSYETAGDEDFNTTCILKPGDNPQNHTLHKPGDVDMIRLDLEQSRPGDVIRVCISSGCAVEELKAELYDPSHNLVESTVQNPDGVLKIVHLCRAPGLYFIRMVHRRDKPGEYSVWADHCGPKITFRDTVLPWAESDQAYASPLEIQGGLGNAAFKLAGGKLPEGLRIDEGTGMIVGKNGSWGRFSFSVTASDRIFPENFDTREFHMDAFMGRKIRGTDRAVFPHYVSGAFSLSQEYSTTTAFPGKIEGGTKGNLRYSIAAHNIPPDRFEIRFDEMTGELGIRELLPVACGQYNDMDMAVDVDVIDKAFPNNRFRLRYDIPVRCLDY